MSRCRKTLWHNCVVHPVCGVLWAICGPLDPKHAGRYSRVVIGVERWADRWHERTAP